MPFRITLSKTADSELTELENNPALKKRFKSDAKALAFLETIHVIQAYVRMSSLPKLAKMVKKYSKLMPKITPHRLIEYFGIMARAKVKSR